MENNLIFPRYLSIQTTSFCNASCVFCPNQEIKNLFPPKVMSGGLYKKIIDECRGYRGIERIILYLNNEPLTDPYIIDRINYAKITVPWASVHILTNGSLLDDQMQDDLINSKLDWIGISVHGIKKQNIEPATGLDYGVVFPRVLNFIQKAKIKRDPDNFLMVTFLKHKYMTEKESNEAFSFWKDQGVSRVSFFNAPISRAGNVSSMEKTYHPQIFGCKSIWANEMIHIVENGEVVLCCMDWRREINLGNVNNQSIREIWNSPGYAQARDQRDGKIPVQDNFICKRCEESIPQRDSLITNPNSAKIALVMVPPWQTKMPPLGLAYLSSFLRSKGIETKVIDLNVKLFNQTQPQKKYLWDITTLNNLTSLELGQHFCAEFYDELNNFVDEVISSKIEIIGLSTTIASINVAVYIAQQIKTKAPSRLIILGGPGIFWDHQFVDKERLVDVFVFGEGELPLWEIIQRFEKSKKISGLVDIPGTMVCLEKKYYPSNTSNPLKDIDAVPLVDFSEFNLKDYSLGIAYHPLPVILSRGCINRCSFCVDHKMVGLFRIKSPQKVFDELQYYSQKFKVYNFEFNDLLCNGNLKQLESICDLIIASGLQISWGSYAAIRKEMSPGLLKKIKNSGCVRLCYGLESASDIVLEKMNKTFDSAIAQRVIRDTHNAGIATAINIIIGHPGESETEFKKTCDFVARNKEFIDEITNVSALSLMPETDLVKNFDKFGIYFKKSPRDYFRMFIKNCSCGCDYRKFYALPDNSPQTRAARLKRMLVLIANLKIPCVIVNGVNEDDANFNEIFQDRKDKTVFSARVGLLKISVDTAKGLAHIHFKNQRLTRDIGLNTSFAVGKQWFDSSQSKWVVKSRFNWLSVKIFFNDLPISQNWLIRVHKKIFTWEIKTYFHKDVIINQQKSGFIFSDQYHKYSINGINFIFPHPDDLWRDIDFQKVARINLIPEINYPVIECRMESFKKRNNFIQLQNLPLNFSARMINFCHWDPLSNEDNKSAGRIFRNKTVIKQRLKFILKNK